ncbi:PAS domain S-box protein [Pseudomonas sp. Q2-TVG4-2]|uniref:PAS domain S-box protein n=1 Tax=Pseudomonas sp. Q2-TVG4-2 TaxID=1685699 RepID=UPI0015E7C3BF
MFNSRLKKELQDQSAELCRLRQLYEQMSSNRLSITLDHELNITAFNQNFARTLGYAAEQLQSRPMSEITPAYVKTLPCFQQFRAAVAKFEPISDDYRYLRADEVWRG